MIECSEWPLLEALMSAVIMYGKPVAEEIETRLARAVPEFKARHRVAPCLAIVQVGSNPESQKYVTNKKLACQRVGMRADLHLFEETVTADELKEYVHKLSRHDEVHGVLIQLPLPRHIEEPRNHGTDKFNLYDAIAPHKDVDGVSRHTIPELYRAQQDRLLFLPCTAVAVRRILTFYKVETEGKKAVVVGRNDITAKPIHHMLGGRMCNATTVWVHRYTPKDDHDRFMRDADLVVTCVGNPKYKVTRDILKPGVVVVDVGTRIGTDGKLHGDVDFEAVQEVASHITPVPRGVGPVTVAALLENLLRAAQFAVGVGKPGYEF